MSRLALVAYLVRDYDEAIAWFTGRLGFGLVEDTPLEGPKRWVRVAPPGATAGGAELLLARAATPEQESVVGRQGGGRVCFFLESEDFARDHATMRAAGVEFVEEPRREPYGMVVVFRDLYGNRWDLVERRDARATLRATVSPRIAPWWALAALGALFVALLRTIAEPLRLASGAEAMDAVTLVAWVRGMLFPAAGAALASFLLLLYRPRAAVAVVVATVAAMLAYKLTWLR